LITLMEETIVSIERFFRTCLSAQREASRKLNVPVYHVDKMRLIKAAN